MAKNELAKLNELFGGGALSTKTADELKTLDDLSQATSFLPRIQLYSGGKAVKKKLIEEGHFGQPKSADEVISFGAAIDVLVIDRKAKAIDMSDTDDIIVSNEPSSKEFQRIVEESNNKDSGCAWGPTYLVFERSTGKFYEFFCGSKSARYESSTINNYLPVTPEMIEAGVTEEKKPRGPKPLTLSSQYIEKGKWAWYAPKASDCLTPFDKLFTKDQLVDEIERFQKREDPKVETVPEGKDANTRKR